MSKTVFITNKTKAKPPRLAFESMKNEVLGKDYQLSVVYVDDKLSQKLNKGRRGKNKPTDILSFALSAVEGEIFLNLKRVREQAPLHGRNFKNFTEFLFIHGLFHLKGLTHGSTMERKERRIRKRFGIDRKRKV